MAGIVEQAIVDSTDSEKAVVSILRRGGAKTTRKIAHNAEYSSSTVGKVLNRLTKAKLIRPVKVKRKGSRRTSPGYKWKGV